VNSESVDDPVGARRDPGEATRHLPNSILSGNEPSTDDASSGPDGSPVRKEFPDEWAAPGGTTRHVLIHSTSGDGPVPTDAMFGPVGSPVRGDARHLPNEIITGHETL
jgi:hypothetical protein